MHTCSAITDQSSAAHDCPGHPECEARLVAALEGVPAGMDLLTAEPASEDDLARVHDPEYIAYVRSRCRAVRTVSYLDPDTYITPASFDIASGAAGCAIEAVRRSVGGEHCFALVRPPGHHAELGRAMGFCVFNNAAIAAAAALTSGRRVAIVDWDYHHGNGTQHMFYDSDRVLYCSVHHGGAFPFCGAPAETGSGRGTGFTVNAPLESGSTIADYRLVFSEVFCPVIERFDPDVLIVSAGQDILSDDPLGMMAIVPEDFGTLTTMLRHACGIPLALVLEGGYGPSHGSAIAHIFRALNSRKADTGMGRGVVLPETGALVSWLKEIHTI